MILPPLLEHLQPLMEVIVSPLPWRKMRKRELLYVKSLLIDIL
jgi:hypothetical protein